jgi:hypothetical protein
MEQTLQQITSIETLRREKIRVKERLQYHEKELSRKMYEIPAELAAAGANSFIPSFLRGKVTNAGLNVGKKLINKFFVPEEKEQSLLPAASKSIGLFRGLKKAFSLFKK